MVDLPLYITVLTTVVTATWILRTKLSDIEEALKAHIARSDARIGDVERRVVSLEKRRR